MSTVLIVGASRGIGLELARQYAHDGWTVHATTRTPDAPGVLGEIEGDLTLHPLDVRSEEQRADLAQAVSSASIDVLIHNAGVGRGTPRAEMMEINAQGPIRTVETLMDAGALAADAKVVLVTSQMGARQGGSGGLGDYGDSKAALNDAFRERAAAWGAEGLTAIVLHPGWVRTDMGGSGAPLSAEDSVAGIRNLVAELAAAHHGGFWTWDGREHPW